MWPWPLHFRAPVSRVPVLETVLLPQEGACGDGEPELGKSVGGVCVRRNEIGRAQRDTCTYSQLSPGVGLSAILLFFVLIFSKISAVRYFLIS